MLWGYFCSPARPDLARLPDELLQELNYKNFLFGLLAILALFACGLTP